MLFEILKTKKKADVWLIVRRIRKQALKTNVWLILRRIS